jgi:3-hydroxyacyl-[acyl-carrier-protein] dehydratase
VKIQTTLAIGADHPSFAGHFPKFPVLPGAVLLDAALRAIESSCGLNLEEWQVAGAKFLSPVRPHDGLLLEHDAAGAGLIHFSVRVGERKVASGTLIRSRQGADP